MTSLRQALEEYLTLRRSLGMKLVHDGKILQRFVSFMEAKGAPIITTDLAVRWATENPEVQPRRCAKRLSAVRQFARYRSAADPRTQVPPPKILPCRHFRKPPRIYSPEEIAHILEAAEQLKPALRARTYTTLFGLLAVTGLRIGEAIALDLDAVDFSQAVLTIHQTKFGKTRLVPVHETTRAALLRYAEEREGLSPRPRTSAFFVSTRGKRLDPSSVYQTFLAVSRRIGLQGTQDRRNPRMHDFRHSFAVRTLIGWYRAGLEIERMMPRLTTYLGHAAVAHTYWYLCACPELACAQIMKD